MYFKTYTSYLLALLFIVQALALNAPALAKTTSCENGECIAPLINKLENLNAIYKQKCLPKNIKHTDIERYHLDNPLSEECWKIITEINHFEEELMAHQNRLEAKLGCDGNNCRNISPSSSINAQLQDLAKVDDNLSCNETKKKQIRAQCGSDTRCVLASSALGLGGPVAELLLPARAKPKGCNLGSDSCITQIATSFLKAVVNFFNGSWHLLKLAGKKIGKSMTQFWNWVSGAEDHSSTSQLAMAKASKDPGVFKQLVNDFPGTMSKLWTVLVASLNEWLKNSIFCQKWSGVPHFSQCLSPMTSFDCLSCKSMLTGLCSLTGTFLSEIVPAFITGGMSIAIKQGVSGAAKISRLYSVSKKSIQVIKSSRFGKAAVASSSKAEKAGKLSKALTLTKNALTAAIAATNTYLLSPARKALKVSFSALSKLFKSKNGAVAKSSSGNFITFSTKAVGKLGKAVLYPIDNPLTAFSYKLGARTIETAFKLRAPKLAQATAITASLSARSPQVEAVLARLDDIKMAPKVNEIALVKTQSELIHQIGSTRSEALRSVLMKGDAEFSEIVSRMYPELEYGALAKVLAKDKVVEAEKELYLTISSVADPAKRVALTNQLNTYTKNNPARFQIVGEAATEFKPIAIKPTPASKIPSVKGSSTALNSHQYENNVFSTFIKVSDSNAPLKALPNHEVLEKFTKGTFDRSLSQYATTTDASFAMVFTRNSVNDTYKASVLGLDEVSSQHLLNTLMENSNFSHALSEQMRFGKNHLEIVINSKANKTIQPGNIQILAQTVSEAAPIAAPTNFGGIYRLILSPTVRHAAKEKEDTENKKGPE